jgi:hypothetical protein
MIRVNTSPTRRELRQFAAIWCIVFSAIAVSFARSGTAAPWVYSAAGVAVLLPLAGLAWLPLLRGVFVGMQYAAFPIGWIVSRTLLLAVFFLVFVPTGLLLRAFGRDPLTRRFDRTRTSYWLARPGTRPAADYFRQF